MLNIIIVSVVKASLLSSTVSVSSNIMLFWANLCLLEQHLFRNSFSNSSESTHSYYDSLFMSHIKDMNMIKDKIPPYSLGTYSSTEEIDINKLTRRQPSARG